jgi:hypothetical protein
MLDNWLARRRVKEHLVLFFLEKTAPREKSHRYRAETLDNRLAQWRVKVLLVLFFQEKNCSTREKSSLPGRNAG